MRRWWKRGKTWRGENLSNLFCSSTWLQLLHLTLCRSLPVDRAFRLTQTVSSLLASISRPVIDLTIDLTKAHDISNINASTQMTHIMLILLQPIEVSLGGHIRLPHESQMKIAAQLQQGVTIEKIMDNIRENTTEGILENTWLQNRIYITLRTDTT